MKIAFATADRVHINSHFGWANIIDVYEVDQNGYTFLQSLTFEGDLKESEHDDKLAPKLEALVGCKIVYVAAIGGGAAARLINHQITPVKCQSEEDEITDVLDKLVTTLNGSPPPWLRKALRTGPSNFDED